MARGALSLESRLRRAEAAVQKTKAQYEQAVKDFEELKEQKEKFNKESLVKLINESGKSYDEILEFLEK